MHLVTTKLMKNPVSTIFIGFFSRPYLDKIPGVSKMLGRDRKNKSFYQMDSEAMYELAIHNAVVSLAEQLTKDQGHRGLSDFEKQIKPGRQ